MEEASLQLTFAFIGMMIGIVIGAFSYHVLGKSRRRIAGMQLELLDKERQVAELKSDMDSQLTATSRQVHEARSVLEDLEHRLDHQARQRSSGSAEDAPLSTAEQEPLADDSDSSTHQPPRDYADGQSGTLSEDFGLKEPLTNEAAQAPEPPRY
ncbi:ZapG family protein [Vreelandella jeotgali]|uniref:ZapG family protein n=1 Tax=Vreelandella jeotgali TaxID=553386 RepID=UPI0003471DDC|nr:DUF1043 family protein [Halomonas jeotgali]